MPEGGRCGAGAAAAGHGGASGTRGAEDPGLTEREARPSGHCPLQHRGQRTASAEPRAEPAVLPAPAPRTRYPRISLVPDLSTPTFAILGSAIPDPGAPRTR